MTALLVSLVLDLTDLTGAGLVKGAMTVAPSMQIPDPGDFQTIGMAPRSYAFRAGGFPKALGYSTDSIGPQPDGWTWNLTPSSDLPGSVAAASYYIPAGPASFTATDATPCVFTWTATTSLTVLYNGTGVQLSGGSLPAGFSAGTTYYVVNVNGSTFELAAAQGGSPIASTSTGSGNLTVVQYNLSALASTPAGQPGQQYLPLPSGTPQAGQVPVATGAGEASAWGSGGFGNPMTTAGDTIYGGTAGAAARLAGNTSTVQALLAQTGTGSASAAPVWMYPAAVTAPEPSGDATGAADTAAIQAIEDGLTGLGGGAILFHPGTYYVTGLVKKSDTIWQGAGDLVTVLELANGSNADVVQGYQFSSLTLGGTAAGITAWSIRDMCIDGNKSNQSGTSYGLRVYGYHFELAGVTIRNCLSWGLYTEWADNPGGVTDGMESRVRNVKIHNCSGGGWHDRGPHDTRSWDVTIWANSSTQAGYWAETSLGTKVASGSNGADLSTFTSGSPGTLNVASTLGYPTAAISATQGAIAVATAKGDVVVTYTGVTATSFTGCVAQGSPASGSTVSTGSDVNTVGSFTANGQLHTQMHVFANPMWDYVLDCQVHLLDCVGEVTQDNGAMILLRYGGCMITGGYYIIYGGVTQHGAGIQVGDTVNPATSNRIDTTVYGLAGSSAATAALNIVNSGANNSIDLLIYQTSGQAIWGNPSRDRVRIFTSGSGSYATDTGSSMVRDYGAVQHYIPAGTGFAWRLSQSSGDYINVDTNQNRIQFLGGMFSRWYTDQYNTPTVEINGSNGRVQPGTSAGRGASIYSGSGAPNVSGSVAGDIYIRTDNGTRSLYTATGANTWGTLPPADLPAGTTSTQGAVQLNGTASDIQPNGTQAAGSSGLVPDAEHVHPAGEPWLASDAGFLTWTFDPEMAAGGSSATATGTIYLTRINVRQALTCTNITLAVMAAGSGLTASECYAGLFSSAGTLIGATADQSSAWTSIGAKTMPLSGGPYALTPGFYWVAILTNGSSVPSMLRVSAGSTAVANMGLTASTARGATNGTGTSLPSSITPSGNTLQTIQFWAALS